MLRSSLFTASAFALVASAAAQSSAPILRDTVPVKGPIKNAGTYHVATGTWTRAASSPVSNFGASENVYSNTSDTGGYGRDVGPTGVARGGKYFDAAAIPGITNPTTFALGGADRELNLITEIQIAYCDFDTNARVAGWTLEFYDDYSPCNAPVSAPKGVVVLTGLPSNGCWLVTADLTAATGTDDTFTLQADGGAAAPGFDGIASLDSFGISWQYTGTGVADAGPWTSGDPAATDTGWVSGPPNTGSNTYYGEVGGCPGFGSGYQNTENVYIEDTAAVGFPSGCYFFGTYSNSTPDCDPLTPVNTPHSGFWMQMTSNGGEAPPVSDDGCVGANTSTGSPAICEVFGDAVAANNNAVLTASGLPLAQFGIFATGLESIPAQTANSGNGWLCINPNGQGGLGRFQGANQIKSTGTTGVISLDTNSGEWSLAAIPNSNGTYAAMAGVTSSFQAWFRETGGANFNFSGSCSVTWQ